MSNAVTQVTAGMVNQSWIQTLLLAFICATLHQKSRVDNASQWKYQNLN